MVVGAVLEGLTDTPTRRHTPRRSKWSTGLREAGAVVNMYNPVIALVDFVLPYDWKLFSALAGGADFLASRSLVVTAHFVS